MLRFLYCYKPTKEEPRTIKTGCHNDHAVCPGGVQEGSVEVRKVAPFLLGDVLVGHIGESIPPDNPPHRRPGKVQYTLASPSPLPSNPHCPLALLLYHAREGEAGGPLSAGGTGGRGGV